MILIDEIYFSLFEAKLYQEKFKLHTSFSQMSK